MRFNSARKTKNLTSFTKNNFISFTKGPFALLDLELVVFVPCAYLAAKGLILWPITTVVDIQMNQSDAKAICGWRKGGKTGEQERHKTRFLGAELLIG